MCSYSLRSLYAFERAIKTDGEIPGLMTIANREQEEWKDFEKWCQDNFLNATTLFQVKETLMRDQRIKWTDLQTFPVERIRRVILDAHKDLLIAETDDLGVFKRKRRAMTAHKG